MTQQAFKKSPVTGQMKYCIPSRKTEDAENAHSTGYVEVGFELHFFAVNAASMFRTWNDALVKRLAVGNDFLSIRFRIFGETSSGKTRLGCNTVSEYTRRWGWLIRAERAASAAESGHPALVIEEENDVGSHYFDGERRGTSASIL
jgi:hypothetical protein